MNPRPDLSIVMPAYNEEHRLAQTLTDTIGWLREQDLTAESFRAAGHCPQ